MAEVKRWIRKYCVLGDGGVGKTSLVRRYTENKFSPDYKMTIGVDFSGVKTEEIDGYEITAQCWDQAGQKHFQFMSPIHNLGSKAFILCFDINKRESYDHIKSEWYKLIKESKVQPVIPVIIVGTKKDLAEGGTTEKVKDENGNFVEKEIERQVSYEEGKALAGYIEGDIKNLGNNPNITEEQKKVLQNYEVHYMETSSKEGENVDEVFQTIIKQDFEWYLKPIIKEITANT